MHSMPLSKQAELTVDVKGKGERKIPLNLSKAALGTTLLTIAGVLLAQYLGYVDVEALTILLEAVSS
jgi:hypothetical protein